MTRSRKIDLAVLCVTALFVLGTAGFCLWGVSGGDEPWQVTVSRREAPPSAPAEESQSPSKLLEGETININTASELELQRLPGIGEARARAIVEWREGNGPFEDPEQLMEVSGIGEGIFGQCEQYITVG